MSPVLCPRWEGWGQLGQSPEWPQGQPPRGSCCRDASRPGCLHLSGELVLLLANIKCQKANTEAGWGSAKEADLYAREQQGSPWGICWHRGGSGGGTGSPEVSQGGGNGVWGWRDAPCMLRWGEPLASPAGRVEAKPPLCPLLCPPI